jgi:RHS repeat-associated protein
VLLIGAQSRLAHADQTEIITDSDGDVVTLQLKGAGTMVVALLDPDMNDQGPIDTITLMGTDAASALTIKVSKVGDAHIRIGSIISDGPLQSISGKTADLADGEGIDIDGFLGALSLATASDSMITLSGAGAPAGTLVLGSLSIAGAVSNSALLVDGSMGKLKLGALHDSTIYAGFTPDAVDDPFAGGTFSNGVTIGSITIKGVKGGTGSAFANSVIGATAIGKVSLGSVETNNAGTGFGVIGNTVGAVSTKIPKFKWNSAGPDEQRIGDFQVVRLQSGGPTNNPPSAPTGVTATGGVQQVTVSWNNVPGATSYNLYRASQSGVDKSNYNGLPNGAKITGATTPYVDAMQTAGTTNFYVVTAVNPNGESAESEQVFAIVQAPANQAPNAVDDSSATVVDNAVNIFVLANDTDPDADTLGVTSFSQPANGVVAFTNNVAHYAPTPSFTGTNTFTYTISDGQGHTDTATVTVIVHLLPPDPGSIAPPPSNGVVTVLADATRFLYTGANAVQYGMDPDTIEFKRAAVIRGKVKGADNAPLPGVHISTPDHPEFGYTYSRADGLFDMAVNGGGLLVVTYQKQGYIPAHRQLQARWQDYTVAPDVVLLPLDSAVTAVTLGTNSAAQVARGSAQTDADGTRRATLIVQPGTTGQFVFPNGTTNDAATLHLRLTEFTVGTNGPAAMPALLPITSAYTYCVDISADEEIAAGASTVLLSQPAALYIENFLGIEVGLIVPLGAYDPAKNAWVGSPNGRVVKIVSITGGLANVDTDGDTVADNTGLTAAEREQLAALYSAGQELWRMPIPHFSATPWDGNYGHRPPDDAVPPNLPSPRSGNGGPGGGGGPLDNPNQQCGSIIEVENQILGEDVPIVGTPFRLHYQSDHVTDFAHTLEIPLSGTNLPASLTHLVLEFTIAGRPFHFEFPPVPNLSTNFLWDGLDVYGRPVNGSQRVVGRTCYAYPGVYQQPVTNDVAWATLRGTSMILENASRQEFLICDEWETLIASWAAKSAGFGGWTLDVQHVYDPQTQVMYYGDGRRRTAAALGTTVIDTFAGINCSGCPYEGVPAKQAQVFAYDIAVAPDGTVYWAFPGGIGGILTVDKNGIVQRVAGGGTGAPDGIAATNANFNNVTSLTLAPDGSIYTLIGAYTIVKVDTDGIVRRVAGVGTNCSQGVYMPMGDGGPATNACILVSQSNIALGPDGSLYLADGYGVLGTSTVRRVDPNGIITTVAGGGADTADGIPATQAHLDAKWVAVGPDGSLYILDGLVTSGNRVRRVGADGKIFTVAGGGSDPNLDGVLATETKLYGQAITVSPQGILVSEGSGSLNRVRLVAGGVIRTVVGSTPFNFNETTLADGVPANQARLGLPHNAAFAPDGSFYVNEQSRIRRVAPVRPGLDATGYLVAEEDGSEVFVFDGSGQHQQTLDAWTGAVRYQFDYDAEGHLDTVTDGDNNVTTIQYDGNGNPTGIVGPYGQTTTFTLDGNGYLASIKNPADEQMLFTYSAAGRLTNMTDARGGAYTFSYDGEGRFIMESDPAGGSKTLTRTDGTNTFTVAISTAQGRTNTHQVAHLPTGTRQRITTDPAGLQDTLVEKPDGSISNVTVNGMTIVARSGPDPRWGMLAPVTTTNRTTTPGGLANVASVTRAAALTDTGDPFSLSNLTETVTHNGRTYVTSYDAATRTAQVVTPAGRQATTVHDSLRRPTREQEPGFFDVTYTYDSRGRLASATGGTGLETRVLSFTYESSGYLQTVTDPLGRTFSYSYDAAGRVLTRTNPGSLAVSYTYDANGNVSSITPPGSPAHSYSHSPVNLRTSYTAPSAGVSNQTFYSYNADRQLTQITRPDGRTVQLDYTDGGNCNCGRLSAVTIGRGIIALAYDPATGNPTSITAPGGIGCSYIYDGGLLSSAHWSGPVTGVVSFARNNDFLVVTNNVNSASPIQYGYDADSLLVQLGSMTLTRDSQNGLITGTTLGGVSGAIAYNGFAEVTNYTAAFASTNLFAVAFTRDKLGRITSKTETLQGITTVFDFQYDLPGRLTNVLENSASVAAYTYDANGNRLRVVRPSGTVTNAYDAQDRLTQSSVLSPASTTTYAYAASGELTNKTAGAQITGYDYDELGNLMGVTLADATRIDYLVDGNNRRIGKKVSGVLVQGFLYQDELRPVAELDGNNEVISRFVYGQQGNVPEFMIKDGATYRILSDELGSPRLVVNAATGAVAQRMDYDEFGNVLLDTNPGFQPFGFAGGLYDSATGLVRFGRRDYDASSGRWLSKDPDGLRGGLNLYAYVDNDPVNQFDFTGTGPTFGGPGGKWVWDPRFPGGYRPAGGGKKTVNESTKPKKPTTAEPAQEPDPSEEPTVKIPLPPVAPAKYAPLLPAAAAGLGGAGAAYLTYRCIRLLPSLIPPLWPTLPANLVTP